MTVDSTGRPPALAARPLPAYWPDLAFGGVVFVIGIIEAFARYGVTGAELVVLFCVAVAAGFFRLRPGLALGLVWVAALLQLSSGARSMFAELAVLAVSFGVARWGRFLTVWLGALSIPAVAVIAGLWSLGIGNVYKVAIVAREGRLFDIPIAEMLSWGLTVVVPLGLGRARGRDGRVEVGGNRVGRGHHVLLR